MEQLTPGAHSDPIVAPAPADKRGAWRAVASFRKLDGEEAQWELRAWGNTEDAARQAVIAGIDKERGTRVQTMGFDTKAVQKYIAASSHMHDLRQSLSAIDAAAGADKADTQRHLIVQAVSIYGRTWGSKVRGDLADYVQFSPDDSELTESIRILRNRFAVHSENTMTVTVPLFDLERLSDGSVELVKIRSMTFEQPLPRDFVERVREMIDSLIGRLTEALEVLKRQIFEEATDAMLAALFQRPELIQMRAVSADTWSPADRRPPFPSSRFRDVHILPGGDGATSATVT
ncbi:hypothetical protein CLV85_1249 [Salinibacterium amurskyense]|uniref:Uncharacterized protein n=1 Tax=Salinibacterium amurskyense TaxID=205941 RepID=A0A2M9D8M4_9MICO|nr:hypothetical protein [Salinibacterium amurskyense]PJJ82061.1 hypothetical protein CLV85_1249 [Salinibacterium amurskyense]RLQ81843.1 hypothetical protein D9C83_06215 [Salinibacterium amurskyense]GHD78326.1 hypothetical protein GCM10007394_05740 [Salinibacterium amurskyense]